MRPNYSIHLFKSVGSEQYLHLQYYYIFMGCVNNRNLGYEGVIILFIVRLVYVLVEYTRSNL